MNPIRKRTLLLKRIAEEHQIPLNNRQLDEIATLNPLKLDDFKAIKGIGDKFIENYGDIILVELRKMEQEDLNNIGINNSLQITLHELEKRLINLSKRNKLLYLAKTTAKSSYDLYQDDVSVLTNFLSGQHSIVLVDLNDANDDNRDQLTKDYKNIHTLIKNIEKNQKDTGQNDLFVGYPFVLGKFAQDPFIVRAPLALFPTKAKVTNQKITISLDESRDVFVNTNLLVAKANFTQDLTPLGEPIWEEYQPATFVSDLLAFYEKQNLIINPSDKDLIPFVDKNADDFNSLVSGRFDVETTAILGHFPNHATSIQRDFHEITKLETLPEHLSHLLSTLDEELDELQPMESLKEISYGEKDLTFINSLNASQEKAQIAIKKGHSLVIEGPPGTGKSQAITNIIAESLNQQKSILMVSEKKAAIDVVYSRLSNLNRYALLLDNMNDKQSFYDQLLRLFDESESNTTVSDLIDLNQSIDDSFNELEELASQLTQKNNDEANLLELYDEVDRLQIDTDEGLQHYQLLKSNIDSFNQSCPYNQLKDKLKAITPASIQSQDALVKIPQLKNLNKKLRGVEILQLKQELTEIKRLKETETNRGFLARMFSKPESELKLDALLDKLFINPVQLNNIVLVQDVLDNYETYLNLESNHDPTLIESISNVSKTLNIDFDKAKSLVLNFNGFEKIDTFESSHRDLIELISDYEGLVSSINSTLNEKAEVCESNLMVDAKKHVLDMINSKRSLEMSRIIERKRKWPLRKFIDKFSLELFSGVKVWLCTPDVVSEIFPLKTDLFDLVIFDEASQMYIERAIPSLIRAQQVVIAGDSKQLRPSSLGVGRLSYDDDMADEFIESTAALDEESLLDLARFRYPSTVLNYHYRSVYEELIAFSNAAFYQNKLVMSPAVVLPEAPVIEVFNVEGKWENRTNQKESDKVIELLRKILLTRKNNETLGVITFNATQRKKIEEDLEEACANDKELNELVTKEQNRIEEGEDKSLFIKNIENVQGDERDIIIFSIAYGENEEGKVISYFGWLNQQGGENRLNVAITRAKQKIYLVTSILPHELKVENSTYPGPKRLKDYLAYCYAVSERDHGNVRVVLDSLYLEPSVEENKRFSDRKQLFIEKLSQQGLTIEKNLGLASYTIDIALLKEGRYQLAIFFDDKRYKEVKHTRTRDLHQDNYLKARGWKVKRIFTRNLYHDLDNEIESVLKLL